MTIDDCGVDEVNSRENVRFAECFALTFLSASYMAFVRDSKLLKSLWS